MQQISPYFISRFQALHQTYDQLSEVILHTIRVDIRCRVAHHLDLALRQVNLFFFTCLLGIGLFFDRATTPLIWKPRSPIRTLLTWTLRLANVMTSLQPHFLELRDSRLQLVSRTILILNRRLHRFVFEGVGHLMEQLLISNARYIRNANELGIQKMMRNILALRQNIKTITDASQSNVFERVKRYYSLFRLSPPVRQTSCASVRYSDSFFRIY